ncbi:MAG: orc1/cdc6 family replication initiation protein [Thermoplasmata archaeon]|nr:orc1/cdc6 family replication initiation protein [Thermoplasmata archaeon]
MNPSVPSEQLPRASAGRGNPELAPPPPSRTGGAYGTGGAPGGSPSGDLFDSVLPPASDIYKGSREILRESYVPARLPHRENQIRQVAEVLSPGLRGELPSNLLIYGKIGTGKTAVVQQVRLEFLRRATADRSMSFLSINCGNIDTPYSLLQTLGNSLAEREEDRIPTGWALDRVQGGLRGLLNARGGICLLVLDEIDRLVARSGDGVLYTLSQINTELDTARLCLIGISNDLKFTNHLDARVRSRLNEEKILFPPYDAPQLQDILRDRAREVFRDGVVDAGVIERCAAYAALENGDARRALALLRLAGEIAERERARRIAGDHVVKAKSRLELDIIVECVRTLPPHCKVLLYAILQAFERRRTGVLTGEVYDAYCKLCQRLGLQPLHARSISNYLSELENLGLVRAGIVSRGRGGRTREIVVDVPIAETVPVLAEDPLLAALARPRGPNQTLLTNFDNPNRS